MNHIRIRLYCLLVLGLLPSLITDFVSANSYKGLIPAPVSVKEAGGNAFVINNRTKIVCPADRPEWKAVADCLAGYVQELSGDRLPVVLSRKAPDRNVICLEWNPEVRQEGFRLQVNERVMRIEVADGAGAFYAVQLLRTLLLSGQGKSMSFTPVELEDYPSLSYRGAMLDVSRHFFSVSQVKRFIDLLAFHRLNYFHWHLTDDQGWRIESKKYPNLTKVGAWRGSENYGGYYTQEEIKEVVAYAAERFITIIPEIDMPGHTQAALAAYPQLGCSGGPYEVATELGGVHRDVMCLGNNFTSSFVKDVLKEVSALFPGPFIHIGGDEVPKDRWQQCKACQSAIRRLGIKKTDKHSAEELLQSSFNVEMASYLKTLGKRMIGWDEVLSDSIDREIVIMSWRGLGRATAAARMGHPVIVSADSHLYLNHYQTINSEQEPRATGGLVVMEKVYGTPFFSTGISETERSRILGAEVCLWTSFVEGNQLLDYMLLPRLAAFAEAAWCEGRLNTYTRFLDRLPAVLDCYRELGYEYADHYFTVFADYSAKPKGKCLDVSLKSLQGTAIYYTLDGSQPGKSGFLYKDTFRVNESCVLKAVAYLPGGLCSDTLTQEIHVNKATFSPIHLLSVPSERYRGDEGNVLVDGIRSIPFHTTGLWVGHQTDSMEVVIDLESIQHITTVEVSALTDLSAWIMGPKSISVYGSLDGKTYKMLANDVWQAPTDPMGIKENDLYRLSLDTVRVRYVKVAAKPFEALPKGHSGEGQPPFMFVDEIRVN